MRLLKFFLSKRRKAESEPVSSPALGEDIPSGGLEYLAEGDDDIRKLARFRVEARLVKQVPIHRSSPPRSWYGGKPQMPDYLKWPVAAGKPMVFVAQIDCSDLPRDLWGGVGPRSGWLLVFLGPSGPGLPVRVIHTADLGPERNPPDVREIDWLYTDTRNALPDGAPITFPKWPVTIYGKASDAPELSKAFDLNKQSHGGTRQNPNGLPWPSRPARNPLTPVGLRILYDSLTTDIERYIKGAETLVSDFTKILERDENPDELQGKSAAFVEDWHHYRDRARRGLTKLQATLPINTFALAELRAVMERHPVERCPEIMSTQDWAPIAAELERIETAQFRWKVGRWSRMAYKGEVYRDQRFELVRPDTVGELRDSLTAIIYALSALEKKLKGCVTRREGLIQRHAALSPDQQAEVDDRRRFELDHSARTLETAKSHVDEARKAWKKLIDLRYGMTGDGAQPVSDQSWGIALEVVSGIVVRDFDLEELLPEVSAREEIEVDTATRPLPDSTYRHIAASKLYTDNPDQLPREVLEHFEPIWESAAMKVHDGMGGEPRWDSVHFQYFYSGLFVAPDDPRGFRAKDGYSPFAPPPFDRDNAMLLQLFSDPIMGWMWGDVSHLVLLMPRDDLAKANFDNVIAIVGG